jgi:hypothetical protein
LSRKILTNRQDCVRWLFFATPPSFLIVFPMSACIDLHHFPEIQQGELSCGPKENVRSQVHPVQANHGDCSKEEAQEGLAQKAAP